jgi:hypothetical protein
MTTAAERKAIRDLGVSARERIVRANGIVERRGDRWYVDQETRNWAGSLGGAKRDLDADEWRAVDLRLANAAVEIGEARRLVAIQLEQARADEGES